MWIKIDNPEWDSKKEDLLKNEYSDCFNIPEIKIGERLFGIWYQLVVDNYIEGYFFINNIDNEYEAEIVISEKQRNKKFGTAALQIIENLINEKGGNKVIGIVKRTNPNKESIITFLLKNGFVSTVPIPNDNFDVSRKMLISLSNTIDVNFEKYIQGNS